jgi:hypothetical protein
LNAAQQAMQCAASLPPNAGGGRKAMKTIRALFGAALVVASFGLAVAKLPAAPPMTDAQKATAEEAKAKAAAAAALAAQQQAHAEDRVAAHYFADMKAKGKPVPAPQMAAAAPAAPAAKAAAPAAKAPAPAPVKK